MITLMLLLSLLFPVDDGPRSGCPPDTRPICTRGCGRAPRGLRTPTGRVPGLIEVDGITAPRRVNGPRNLSHRGSPIATQPKGPR
jgi:hypothetical protein